MKFTKKVKYKVVYKNNTEFAPKFDVEVGDEINLLDAREITKKTFLVEETYSSVGFLTHFRYLVLFKVNEKNTLALLAIHTDDEHELYKEYLDRFILVDGKKEIGYNEITFSRRIIGRLLERR